MMKTRFAKILTLTIACLLLIGAAIGVSASAETTPTVEIVGRNLVYEGAVQVIYAVDAQNVTEDMEVVMYFWNENPTDTAVPEYTKTAGGTVTIGDVTYLTFYSHGAYPKDMKKNIYAMPVVLSGDEVVATGALAEYSIYTYAMNRFKASPSADQIALYSDLLDYGAYVQKVLLADENSGYTEEDLIAGGGYINQYSGVAVDTYVDGKKVGTEDLGYFCPGDKVNIDADKTYEGALFDGYTDAEGNAVGAYGADKTASSWNKYDVTAAGVGTTTYIKNYNSEYIVEDYSAGGLATNYVFFGTNTTEGAPTTAEKTTDKKGVASTATYNTSAYALVKDEYLEFNKYIQYVTDSTGYAEGADTSGAYKVGEQAPNVTGTSIQFNYTGSYSRPAMHVFESDIKFNTKQNGELVQISLGNDNGTIWGFKITGQHTGGYYTLNVRDANKASSDNEASISAGRYHSQNEWINLRVEYYPIKNADEMAVKVYVNGEFIGKTFTGIYNGAKSEYDVNITKLSFLFIGDTYDASLAFDNTVFQTILEDANDYYGKGKYVQYAEEGLVDAYNGTSGKWVKKGGVATVAYENGVDGNRVLDVNATKLTTYADNVINFPMNITAAEAEAYVFETDIKWLGATHRTGADNWGGRMGFKSTASQATSTSAHNSQYLYCDSFHIYTNDDLYLGGSNKDTYKRFNWDSLAVGVWYNLRYVYIPGEPTVNDSGTTVYPYTYQVYVNNELVKEFTDTGASDNSDCIMFSITMRNNYGKFDSHFQLDNTYVGPIKPTSPEDYYGEGLYKDSSYSYDDGWDGGILANYTTTTFFSNVTEGDNATMKIYHENGSGNYNGQLYFSTNTPDGGIQVGKQSYVFETDIKWLAPTHYSDVRWWAKFGFTNDVNKSTFNPIAIGALYTASSSTYLDWSLYYDDTASTGRKLTDVKKMIEVNSWNNLRVVYTPTGQDSSGNYTGVQNIYVNNILFETRTISSATDNTAAVAFGLSTQKWSSTTGMLLDNTYCGIVDIAPYTFEHEIEGIKLDTSSPVATYALAVDPTDAENSAMKIDVVGNTAQLYDQHTFTMQGRTDMPLGTYEVSYDILFDGLEANAVTKDTTIQDVILNANSCYLEQIYLQMKSNGKFSMRTEITGNVMGKPAIPLCDNLDLNDGKWHKIRIFVNKGTWDIENSVSNDTWVSVYLDGVCVADKVITYNHSLAIAQGAKNSAGKVTAAEITAAENGKPVSSVAWRVRSLATKQSDNTYLENYPEADYTVYFDNLRCGYVGEIPAELITPAE